MALGFTARDINKTTETRNGRVMTDLACPKERIRTDGVRTYVYQLPASFTGAIRSAA